VGGGGGGVGGGVGSGVAVPVDPACNYYINKVFFNEYQNVVY
jgi:hypothetical protein